MTLLRVLVMFAALAGIWWSIFGPGTCGVCGKYVDNGIRHHMDAHRR